MTPPAVPISPSLLALAAHGVRLKVLAQIFPVLRHDVVGPLSNASLAAAMLRQSPEGADANALQQRCQRLAGDLTGMLDDGVAVVRELDQWLADNGARTSTETLLRECRKLMFSQLLLSRQSVVWPEDVADEELPQFTSRYLLLAWLLSLLQAMPADVVLTLDLSQTHAWHAHFSSKFGDDDVAAPATAITPQDVELLAAASGWRLERQAQCWSLHLPAPTPDK
ncbi:hypothetical protein [Achromobacter kerstersii]|uniref:hypothetical protein n=1 Tax=Achromobacter kerstersii TaxID=1353890 RepID=UPI0006BFFEDF|nr:hypothetical protein [Achromobacter kerstersii]CUJ71599.1 Uncharacterised protein [Achromobacter kerstersii]